MRRSGLALLQQLAVLPLARSQPNMGEPLSEILMVSDDNEFHEAVHGPSRRGTTDYRSSASCWAMLFVNGEEEQLPSISLLEARRAYRIYGRAHAVLRYTYVAICGNMW